MFGFGKGRQHEKAAGEQNAKEEEKNTGHGENHIDNSKIEIPKNEDEIERDINQERFLEDDKSKEKLVKIISEEESKEEAPIEPVKVQGVLAELGDKLKNCGVKPDKSQNDMSPLVPTTEEVRKEKDNAPVIGSENEE